MLRPEDRIRTERIVYKGVSYIRHVHACRNCGCEILRSVTEEKKSTGYCKNCHPQHRPVKTNHDGVLKYCKACDRNLPLDKFIRRGNNQQGFSTCCAKCHNLKKFGINSLEYELLYEKQDGKCAICNNPETANDKNKSELRSLAVDHDLVTGKVRGLLCTNCNIGLGHLKDNVSILEEAINYLNNNNNNNNS